MDHGFNAWGRGAAWLRLAIAPTCVAVSEAAAPAPAPEDAPPAWEYVHTCVFVEVEGPFSSNRPEVCSSLVNCSCWPTLACNTRVCVPWTIANLPGKCPDCGTP